MTKAGEEASDTAASKQKYIQFYFSVFIAHVAVATLSCRMRIYGSQWEMSECYSPCRVSEGDIQGNPFREQPRAMRGVICEC